MKKIKNVAIVLAVVFTFNCPMSIIAYDDVSIDNNMRAFEEEIYNDEIMPYSSQIQGNDVQTPEGLNLKTWELAIEDYTPTEKNNINDDMLENYPHFKIISNPTMKYNCHSYAWYNQDFENNFSWIEDTAITSLNSVLPPSGYMESDGRTGDIICYVGADGHNYHSGIVVARDDASETVTVQSKWGSYGLYEHDINDCYEKSELNMEDVSVTVKYYRPTSHNHSFTEIAETKTSEWHGLSCSDATECGVIIWEEHNFTYVNNGNNATHQKICADCGTTVSEAHNFIYTNNSDGETHKIICSDCGYVYGNSTHYSSLYTQADGKHSGICTSCGALFYEPHNWVYETLSGKYRCTVCNAITDSPSVGLNDPEDSEQMAIKPDRNFIAPGLFDKRWLTRHKA